MNKIRQFILDRDMFSHAISLNFDRNGDVHRTLISGLCSCIVKSAIAFYIFLRFRMLIFREGDDNQIEFGTPNLHHDPFFKDLRYDSTNLMIFHYLKKTLSNEKIDLDDPELPKYIDIKFRQTYVDFYKSYEDWETTEIPARKC